MTLTAGDLSAVRRLPILRGHWLASSRRVYPGGVVVNQTAARLYGQVGTQLSISLSSLYGPFSQRIVGVAADGSSTPMVYLSLTSALAYQQAALAGRDDPTLYVHAPRAGEVQLRGAVNDVASDLSIDPSEVQAQRADTVAQLVGSLRATRAAFLGVAGVTLLVAIVGLLNIGLATVRERTRELTVRRAVGATRLRIFGLVLLATLLLGVLAALVADSLALLTVTLAVPRLLDPASAVQPPQFPWIAAIAGLTAAVCAATLGGTVPAWAATRVDMAYALRD